METGDIIIVLDEKSHERFDRKGSDLICKMVSRVHRAVPQNTATLCLYHILVQWF